MNATPFIHAIAFTHRVEAVCSAIPKPLLLKLGKGPIKLVGDEMVMRVRLANGEEETSITIKANGHYLDRDGNPPEIDRIDIVLRAEYAAKMEGFSVSLMKFAGAEADSFVKRFNALAEKL